MADLSAISPDRIQALEEALESIGISVGDVDGVADDGLKVGILTGLNTLNRIFGSGEAIEDYDAEQVAQLKQFVETFIEGDGTTSQFDMLKALVDRDFAKLGIDGTLNPLHGFARGIINGHFEGKTAAEALPGLLRDLSTREGYEFIGELLDKIPPNILADLPSALEFIDKAKDHMTVIDLMAEGGFFVEKVDPEVIANADPVEQQKSVIEQVETALGIETPDGQWGKAEQQALLAKIKQMQEKDSKWAGQKNGVYSDEFAAHVLSDPGFSEEEKKLFENLGTLKTQGVELVAPADEPFTPEDINGIEAMLVMMTPYVQEKYEEEKLRAERLIEAIQGGKASELEIKHAVKAIAEAEEVLKEGSGASAEEIAAAEAKKAEAEEYLDRTNLGRDIGDFIDGFLFLGESHFGRDDYGRRMVQIGQNWAIDQIQARLDTFNDLPDVSRFTLGDGRLDMVEQTALQGILVLMSEKFGIQGLDRWDYTPELGQKLKNGILGLSLDEKEELFEVFKLTKPEGYGEMSAEDKTKALDVLLVPKIDGLLELLDRAEAAGVLVPHQLYQREDVEIPDVTVEIFEEFLNGKTDTLNAHYHQEQATPVEREMMNLLVYDFTEGLDIHSLFGEDIDNLPDINAIDPTQTMAERFEAMYQEGIDLNDMYDMLETLPFGTDERREQFELLFKTLEMLEEGIDDEDAYIKHLVELEKAKFSKDLIDKIRDAQEKGDVSVEILASIYANGVSEINANPEAGSDYLFRKQRSVIMDPRLKDFTINDGSVTAKEIFELHKDQVNNFQKPVTYEPIFFKDDNGVPYVGVVDIESRIFQIEVLDLEGWKKVVAENPKQPGENDYAYNLRLDEALSDVSGYDLIYQNLFESSQATFNTGSFMDFPNSGIAAGIQSFDEVKATIGGIVQEREDIAEAELEKRRTPEAPAYLRPNFKDVAGTFTEEEKPEPDALDVYDDNAVDADVGGSTFVPSAPAPGLETNVGR